MGRRRPAQCFLRPVSQGGKEMVEHGAFFIHIFFCLSIKFSFILRTWKPISRHIIIFSFFTKSHFSIREIFYNMVVNNLFMTLKLVQRLIYIYNRT